MEFEAMEHPTSFFVEAPTAANQNMFHQNNMFLQPQPYKMRVFALIPSGWILFIFYAFCFWTLCFQIVWK
jgi:hypothetical protein